MAIPKIIHQTYFSGIDLPEGLRRNIEFLRQMNPGWQYVFYDDDAVVAFIKANFDPAILATYLRINPVYGAARADLFRYLLMFRVGGVYFDIKSHASQPLDNIVNVSDRYVLAHWPNQPGADFEGWGQHPELVAYPRGEFQNWHICAEPGHPFLRNVLAHVMSNIRNYDVATHGVGQLGVLRTTGPIAYTQAIGPLLPSEAHRLAGTHADLHLRYSIYDGVTHRRVIQQHYIDRQEPVVLV